MRDVVPEKTAPKVVNLMDALRASLAANDTGKAAKPAPKKRKSA